MKVERKPISSAGLVTVDESAKPGQWCAGVFVRIKPTAAATDEQLKALKKGLQAAGATAVRIMPRPPSDKLQLSKGAQAVSDLMVNDAVPQVRDLMASLVAASTSKRKAELTALLERLADEEGL